MSGYRAKNRFTLDVKEGDAFAQDFIAPTEISLSGKSIRCQLRKNATAPAVVLELSTAAGTITKSGQTFTLIFTPAATTGKAGSYPCDIEVYTDETDVLTIAEGDITITAQITRPA